MGWGRKKAAGAGQAPAVDRITAAAPAEVHQVTAYLDGRRFWRCTCGDTGAGTGSARTHATSRGGLPIDWMEPAPDARARYSPGGGDKPEEDYGAAAGAERDEIQGMLEAYKKQVEREFAESVCKMVELVAAAKKKESEETDNMAKASAYLSQAAALRSIAESIRVMAE